MQSQKALSVLISMLLLAAASLALTGQASVAATPDDDVGGPNSGNMLRIPGLPPIPLPPGSRAFGPDGAQRRQPDAELAVPPSSGRAAQPVPQPERPAAPAAPKTRAALLDELFDRLKTTSDDDEAQGIAGAIERVWLRSGSDTADLLMDRALKALNAKDNDLCRQLLDKIVVLDPDWAEGWNKRATIRFFADDYPGAMEDIAHVLALEPRHFGALSGMGFILQRADRDKEALAVFRKVLEIYPQQDDIRKIVEKLTLDVDGRDI
jgi:tetratricopeptide (TPR) repeat protein